MKKIVCYALIAALALSLCACANSDKTIGGTDTEGGTPFVEALDPFLETESGGTDSEDDDAKYDYLRESGLFTEDYIAFLKHEVSSFSIDNLQVKANGESYGEKAPVTYRGGEVEISFTATGVYVDASEFSEGFRVFIGDTPQILSLNGSEASDMVVVEGKKGDTKECTIRFTPRLTKENLADKDDLKLTFMTINNPLYLTFGSAEHIDFKHRMWASHIPFKLEGDFETIELVSGKSFEHFANRDSEVSKYFWMSVSEIEGAAKEETSAFFELYSATKEEPVVQDGKADITLLLYGGKPATPLPYKVYFYVNHEPVKVDGCDYIAAELKYGFAAKYSTTVDNLKAGNIVYAIAIAENIASVEGVFYHDLVMKTDTRRLFAAD